MADTVPPSEEKAIFFRLSSLLIDGGTVALRSLFDHYVPPGNLQTHLQTHINTLQTLKRYKHLKQSQEDLLFPSPTDPPVCSSNFDITLLIMLLRNICGLRDNTTFIWGVGPASMDHSEEADIVRIREFRKTVQNTSRMSIEGHEFENLWTEIKDTILRVERNVPNFTEQINRLKSDSIDPQKEDYYKTVIREREEKDKEMREDSDKLATRMDATEEQLKSYNERLEDIDRHDIQIDDRLSKLNERQEVRHTDVKDRIAAVQQEVRDRVDPALERLQWPALPIEILRMDGKAIKLYKTALEEGEEVDHSIRIMIIGHFGVGKTTLARRLLGEPVNIQDRDSTNGIDVHICRCKVSSSDLTWLSLQPDVKSNTARKRLAKVIANGSTGEEVREEDAPTPAVEEILKTTAAKTESGAKQIVDVQGDEMLNSGEQLETQSISKPSDDKEKEKEEEDEDTVSFKEMKALVESGTLDSGEFASVSLWDFAGQYVFYTTHQMFLSPRSVYLLVTDISKHIREVVMEDECYIDSSGPKQCNISEYIDFWLNSIHTCSSDDPCDESTVPPVILVGTHADKLTKAKVTDDGDSHQREENCNRDKLASAYFETVRNHLREKPTQFHLADEDFDIDNTVNDSKLNDLKKKIVEVAQQQPHWGTRIPAKWLPLEAALYGLNEKIVDFVRIEELNDAMSVPISTAEELELFLQFHHQSGNILYFSEGSLKEKVVLDPQWLVNALKSLITANMFYSKNPHVMEKWREFRTNGILRPQLLDAVWHKEKNPSFHDNREHLLALMEKLKLISRPMLWHKDDATPTTKKYHLAPCMLKEKPPEVILSPCHGEDCETTSILVFYFKRKFLSPAIFHRLLAACLSKWPLWRQGERDRIFCGCGVFKIDQTHKLTLVFRDFTIQAFVTKFGRLEKSPREETCIDVRDFLDNSLTFLTGCIATSSLYKLCIKCPENKSNSVDAIIPVSKLQEEKEVVCSCHDSTDTHVINSVDMLKYWFPCKPDSVTAPLNTGFIPDGKVSCLSTERLRTRPTQRHLGKISQRIGRKCELLVVELGLETHDIEQIQMDKSLDVKTCIFRMLCFWEEKFGMNATFGCLENAMIAVGIDTIKVFEDIDSWDN